MSSELPDSVVGLLKSKHFVHLATCLDNSPHVSLMNYTYYSQGNNHYIIISTPINTTKYKNMTSNPRVSLLVHDWITSKLAETGRRNSLYELLTNINKAETNSVSVMLDGEAAVVAKSDLSYSLYKSLLLNGGFKDDVQAENYLTSDDNALVLITIKKCKVTDADNNVQQY
ncbi:hypothetical protein METBIDRAFT_79545 [Metschnikowia bicuspidata var. bicuspidata NRRL YB-4993]|uniref:Pyridoxamine 5'-phosphate oxidase N-terminal domain-containing protein n=1 Tax=Metschnikowia bicuspidata var. bicuspidata NRRL YB-4993 TaxID=869754 RepID=A0A1A0H621_9ASCO|nr:hypothetical protein METBIDRAFT_79545 [Metschnikowia bicuspidata var. bicuspidata NRRL YB-4993]OBA19534.1 hypothetical protein METBIDRAFT_79545 [Metschnikowia bicuspidata var. bicuspidata NRRL YB-4993]